MQPTTVQATPPALVIHHPAGPVSALPTAPTCWANCDGSTTAPTVNVLDFACFQNAFGAGDLAKADCDHDRRLTTLDFACFTNAVAAGCPDFRTGGQTAATPAVLPLEGWTVYSTQPFRLRFEATRQVTLMTDAFTATWLEQAPILVELQSPADWQAATLPPPKVIDNRTPPSPIRFEDSPRSFTRRKR